MLRVYLAGPIVFSKGYKKANDWRKGFITEFFNKVEIFNPMRLCRFNFNTQEWEWNDVNEVDNEIKMVEKELFEVSRSDILVVNMGNHKTSVGTWMEMLKAKESGVMVLFHSTKKELREHSFVKYCCSKRKYIFKDWDDLKVYLTELIRNDDKRREGINKRLNSIAIDNCYRKCSNVKWEGAE